MPLSLRLVYARVGLAYGGRVATVKATIGLIALAIAVLLAPLVWHLSGAHLRGDDERVVTLETELATLRDQVATQDEQIAELKNRVDGLDTRTARTVLEQAYQGFQQAPQEAASDALKDSFAQVVLIASRRDVNEGLTVPSSTFLQEFLGLPREVLSDDCEEMENETLAGMLELADVGPIRVRMLRPAIISLKQVFRNVQVYEPELYARIQSAGSLCVRRVRGSDMATSSHAYGLAVDLNIDGQLDTLGDGKTQLGLTILADFFHQEGWIWGAGFGREDSMHFEISREKLETWRRLGQI